MSQLDLEKNEEEEEEGINELSTSLIEINVSSDYPQQRQ